MRAVLERRVAQPVPELVKRRGGNVLVGRPAAQAGPRTHVVIDGNLAGGAGKRDGEPARGIAAAQQDVGHARRRRTCPAARWPGSQSIFGSIRCNSMGRPAESTSTTGLPAAATSRASSSCTPGSLIDDREAFSPLIVADSPRHSSTTSDCFGQLDGLGEAVAVAAVDVAASGGLSLHAGGQPLPQAPAECWSRRPACPCWHQLPSIVPGRRPADRSRRSGGRVPAMGRTLRSFFSKTIDWAASSSASLQRLGLQVSVLFRESPRSTDARTAPGRT